MLFSSKNIGWNADTLLPILIMSAVSVLMISLLFSQEYLLTDQTSTETKKPVFMERIDSISYISSKKDSALLPTDSTISEAYHPSFDKLFITPRRAHFFTQEIIKSQIK
jgi:hypothetical protein